MENTLTLRKFNNVGSLRHHNIQTTTLFNNKWINEYADYLQYKPKTKNAYIRNTFKFIEWLNVKGIANPTRKDIITFKNELINGVKDENGEWIVKPKEASTIQAYLNSIKQFFKWLSYENIYDNIADGIRSPNVEKRFRKNPLSEEEAKYFIKSIDTSTLDGLRNQLIVSIGINCGLRDNEIANIQIKDFYRDQSETYLKVLGKGFDDKNNGVVQIPPKLERRIKEYLNLIGEDYNQENEHYLFRSYSNRNAKNVPMLANSISRIVKQLLIKANLKDRTISSHSMRHSTAQIMHEHGATLEEIQQVLRHKNISTTMTYLKEWNRQSNHGEKIVADAIFDD